MQQQHLCAFWKPKPLIECPIKSQNSAIARPDQTTVDISICARSNSNNPIWPQPSPALLMEKGRGSLFLLCVLSWRKTREQNCEFQCGNNRKYCTSKFVDFRLVVRSVARIYFSFSAHIEIKKKCDKCVKFSTKIDRLSQFCCPIFYYCYLKVSIRYLCNPESGEFWQLHCIEVLFAFTTII
jgi:hypothetical protein